MRPSSRSQSAATTALTATIGELFRVKFLREIPDRWILGRPRCPPLCQGPLHSPAPARTLSTVRRCTLEVVHDVVIIVLSIALLSTESASLYPFGPSNLGAADATPRLTKPPCGGLLSLPTLDL